MWVTFGIGQIGRLCLLFLLGFINLENHISLWTLQSVENKIPKAVGRNIDNLIIIKPKCMCCAKSWPGYTSVCISADVNFLAHCTSSRAWRGEGKPNKLVPAVVVVPGEEKNLYILLSLIDTRFFSRLRWPACQCIRHNYCNSVVKRIPRTNKQKNHISIILKKFSITLINQKFMHDWCFVYMISCVFVWYC